MVHRESWGRYPNHSPLRVHSPQWIPEARAVVAGSEGSGVSLLPFGLGRSYGDSCLNDGGDLVCTRALNRLISFNRDTGVLECEGGVSLAELLDVIIPAGWFLPVSPGTRFVTVGGAIANDIHGKNHHRAGTFGCHVAELSLLRSDGFTYICSLESNPDLFSATIGGLGLTGLITKASFRLKKIENHLIEMDSIQCKNLDDFLLWSERSDKDYEYTVSWIDCLARGASLGRGIFMRGNHATGLALPRTRRDPFLAVPFDFPRFALNQYSVAAFNAAYFHKQRKPFVSSRVDYEPFFYPLDAVLNWNRIYGKRGFLQFQCVVPSRSGDSLRRVLETVTTSGTASFLAVLKEFGGIRSPGLLSFPRPGATVCFDFPFEGDKTLRLFRKLEEIVVSSEGALYPAKDATMSPRAFKQFYPRWQDFSSFVDTQFSSSFWRRVTCSE